MTDRAISAFNTLSGLGLVPVPVDTQSGGILFHCHTPENREPGSAAIVACDRATGRWGALAPGPLQVKILDALNGSTAWRRP